MEGRQGWRNSQAKESRIKSRVISLVVYTGAKSKIRKNAEGSPVKVSPFTKIVNKQTVYMALLFLTANATAALVAIVSNS